VLVLAACQGSPERENGPPPSSPDGIRAVRQVGAAAALGGQPAVEIEVYSAQRFPVRNEIAVLRIGSQEFRLSSYPPGGDTRSLVFTLTLAEFARTNTGDPVTLYYGQAGAGQVWQFGRLDKGVIRR
jgi:hypothetical protein